VSLTRPLTPIHSTSKLIPYRDCQDVYCSLSTLIKEEGTNCLTWDKKKVFMHSRPFQTRHPEWDRNFFYHSFCFITTFSDAKVLITRCGWIVSFSTNVIS
jgi:hypothetical protein